VLEVGFGAERLDRAVSTVSSSRRFGSNVKFGRSPANSRGIRERIEWQSYTTTLGVGREGARPRSSGMVIGFEVEAPPRAIPSRRGVPARYRSSPSNVVVGRVLSSLVLGKARRRGVTIGVDDGREIDVRMTVAPGRRKA